MTRKRIAVAAIVILLLFLLNLICLQYISGTPDVTKAPGVVVGHQPAPSLLQRITGRAQYLGSPSLTILSDGSYVASHDLFGWGSSQDTAGITKIYRSVDRGESWVQTATLEGQFWSTVFAHKDALYIIGAAHRGGNIIIRKSMDGGYTWTVPFDENNGLLKKGKFGGTPNCPVIHEGRLWIAQSTRVMSAPVDSNLLLANSWTLSKSVPQDKTWLNGKFPFWSEGQVVASPEEGVVVLPKLNQLPYTAIIRAKGPVNLTFDPVHDFVELPGAEKKFGAVYDPVSERFYACSNPVLPSHKDEPKIGKTPAMIRNTAALFCSEDLRHWEMKKIFLYSPDLHHEAFQYLNCVIDGDDLLVISRTAFVIGGPKPPRGHDSNLMTFHRISDFRNAAPEHELVIEGNRVLRYERTQHECAPLGDFPLGNNFDEKPLGTPVGLEQHKTNSAIYIKEKSGRILEFDPAGNFQNVVSYRPLTMFVEQLVNIKQPRPGFCTWTGADSSLWEEPANWYYWNCADLPEEIAVFGSAAKSDMVVSLNHPLQLQVLWFQSDIPYTIRGNGTLYINHCIAVMQGKHIIQTRTQLSNDTRLQVNPGTGVTFEGALNLNGKTLTAGGGLTINGPFKMDGGKLVVGTIRPIIFGNLSQPEFNGSLVVNVNGTGVLWQITISTFQVFEFPNQPIGTFDNIELPELLEGQKWDTSELYTTGTIKIVPDSAFIPEVSRAS